MSNFNTVAGFYNLPAQAFGTTAQANVITVPASGYAGLPSPILVAGSGLTVSLTPDIAAGYYDVHPFKIRLCGKATTTGAASTIIPTLYQVPATAVGVIGAAGSVTSAGIPGSACNLVHTCATIASSNVATVWFAYEWQLIFNSIGTSATAGALVGFCASSMTNFGTTPVYTINAVISGSSGIVGTLKLADMNFEPCFQVSANTAPNSITVTEFSIDRV